jgi:GT2 family glycosyltransferase/glycosyltransferase involved in cell wall biosynthesis
MNSPLQELKLWLRAKNRERLHRRHLAKRPHEELLLRTPLEFTPPVPLDAVIEPEGLELKTSEAPEVSVLIPAYGDAALTLRCLASLARHPPALPYEVIVADDATGEQAVAPLRRVKGMRLIVNETNVRFLLNCNQAAQQARGRYLLLLNNDTQVLPGAVEALRATFDQHPRVGLVGAKLLEPSGRLQDAGGIVWNNGSALNYGRGDDPRDPAYSHVREIDIAHGAAMMIDMALWQQLGGFDTRYCPAYYEDTDLAFAVRAAGRRVLYQPAAQVMHVEGATNGTDANPTGIKRYQLANRDKFVEKWKPVLERDQLPDAKDNVLLARERGRFKPVVLVTNDQIVEPDRDAGSRAIDQLLDALIALGYSVKFWPENPREGGAYAERLRQRGIETMVGAYRPDFEDWMAKHGRTLSAAVMNRPPETFRLLDAVRRHSNAWVVYYGHDLHFQRMQAQAQVVGDPVVRSSAEAMYGTESALWQRVNISAYFSQEEVDEVKRRCPDADARLVQAYCFEHITRPTSPTPGRGLLFVAGFGHPPNVDAAAWLVREIMPRVWAEEPSARLKLVGSKPTDEVRALAGERVEVTGYVSDERLEALYRQARVAVVPLRFGAGVKHKVVEALAQGVPLVTTPVGAQGLPWLNEACAIAEDPAVLAAHILRLLRDDAAWLAAAQRAADLVQAHYSPASLRQQVASMLPPQPMAADRRTPDV